jgi:hypothetical protein
MGEVLFVAAILLLLIGAMGFYFYSRIAYTEKKLNLLETILLDIKMMMEMEEQPHVHGVPPAAKNIVLSEPEQVQSSEVEELKEDASGYYASVIDSIAKEEPPVSTATEEQVGPSSVVPPVTDYETFSRDELSALAEKRSLRVTKRMNRQTLLTILRESDKNTSVTTEQVGGDVAGADADANGGAPLEGSEAIPSESI